jgi:hypothetical protein
VKIQPQFRDLINFTELERLFLYCIRLCASNDRQPVGFGACNLALSKSRSPLLAEWLGRVKSGMPVVKPNCLINQPARRLESVYKENVKNVKEL